MSNLDAPPRASGTSIYLLGNLAEGLLAIVFTILLVRLISQEDFGAWRQYMIVYGLATNILIFGLPRSLLYFYSVAADKPERVRIALRTLLATLALGLLTAIIYLAASGLAASAWSTPELASYAGLFALYLVLTFPQLIYQPFFLANDRRRELAGWKTFFAATRLLILVYLLLAGATLHTLLIGINLHAAMTFAIILYLYLRISGISFSDLLKDWRKQLQYSWHVTLQSIGGVINRETDKILVSSSVTTEQFASYSVGARELPLIQLFPYAIGESLSPDLARLHDKGSTSEFLNLWHVWMRRVAILLYPLFGLIVFQHEAIIALLYTRDYIAGAIPFLIFSCLIPIRLTGFGQTLLAMNKAKVVAIGANAGLAVTLICGYIGLKLFGMAGAALGVLISEYAMHVYYWEETRKGLKIGWLKLLPWLYLGKTLALSLVVGGLATFILPFAAGWATGWRLAIYCGAYGLLYLLGIRILGLLAEDDLRKLKHMLLRR